MVYPDTAMNGDSVKQLHFMRVAMFEFTTGAPMDEMRANGIICTGRCTGTAGHTGTRNVCTGPAAVEMAASYLRNLYH